MSYADRVEFGELLGKTLTNVEALRDKYDDRITFTCSDGTKYLMHHEQDCCEGVNLEDIVGDLDALIGEPILLAEEAVSTAEDMERGDKAECEAIPTGWAPESVWIDSFTWTFYKLRTMHGSVTIRWYGESNGYYSESVDFELVPDEGEG